MGLNQTDFPFFLIHLISLKVNTCSADKAFVNSYKNNNTSEYKWAFEAYRRRFSINV